MFELWVPLKDIPAEGREFHFTDQSLWTGPMGEFGLEAKIAAPFEATMFVAPQDDGFLVTGSFSGSLSLPCDRCAEVFELPVSGSFESFESAATGEADGEAEGQDGGESRLRLRGGNPELDAAGLLWEQFLLALPASPLCREDCRGLCAQCGANRNEKDCGCAREEGDARLAVLRKLKLQ